MTAKEYLRQLSRKDARINALIERQRRYRELAERRTAVYRDTSGGGRRCSSSGAYGRTACWRWRRSA